VCLIHLWIQAVLALLANREGATRGETALLERLLLLQEELAAAKQGNTE